MHKNKVEKKHVFNVYVKRVKKPHSLSSLYFAIIVAIVELHFLFKKENAWENNMYRGNYDCNIETYKN